MEQLSGQDAAFLYAETPSAPLHVGAIGIYDPSTSPTMSPGGQLDLDEIYRVIRERLHLARLRRKVVRVPMDLDHPYWVEDEHFDLEYHIRRSALPRPGSWRDLYQLAARILARPLDMTRPPWEVYYVDGLDALEGVPEGCFAVLSKTHHCAIDGVSGVNVTELLHDLTPEARVVEPPDEPWQAEEDPKPAELLARTYGKSFLQTAQLAQLLAGSLPSSRRLFGGMLRRELGTARPPVARTRFNRAVSPHRVVGCCRCRLDEIRAMRGAVEGATVNDVVVALCGGALRRFLDSKGELPTQSIVAMAPVNVRTEDEKLALGNRISAMLLSVGSDVEDPAERLAAVQASSSQAKALTKVVGARTMANASQLLPGSLVVMATRLASQMGLANFVGNPAFNCVITNVPGPRVPLYSMGARLVTTVGYGPIVDGMGLFIAVGSYCGELSISFDACRKMLPDPERLQDCILESYEEMKGLIEAGS